MDIERCQQLKEAGINYKEGLDRFMGNEELYFRFLNKFPNDASYGKMLDAIDDKDAEEAFKAAHTLKGVAGNLSMERLYEKMNILVDLLRKGRLDGVEELLLPVKENYELVITKLKQIN